MPAQPPHRRLPYDGHVHTVASDGRNTARECVRAAEAVGLRAIAITDHYWGGEKDRLARQLRELAVLDASSPVTVIPGVEATILNPRGHVSISPREAELVRWVLVDFSGRTDGIARNAPVSRSALIDNIEQAMCAAAANPIVDAIAHPFNLGRWSVQLLLDELPREMLARIASAMAANNCAFEIMAQAYWWFPDLSVPDFVAQFVPILQLFAEAGVNFVVGSDAHSVCGVGNLTFCEWLMAEAGIGTEMLVDLEAINEARRRQRARDSRIK